MARSDTVPESALEPTAQSTAEAVVVRPYTDADAAAVAALYNGHRDAPNWVDRPLDAAMVRTELAERGTVVFLLAEAAGEVLGTVGMFRTSGRRVVADGEVFGDMFFLHPWIRGGAVAGRMFSQAFLALMPAGVGTIRLTVSPVNDRALPLYRQLGCTLVGPAGAGEDGNIELVSHLPRLVARMQADHADLIPASRRMTAGWRYSAGALERPLGEHTEIVSGRPVLRTAITLDGLVFRALLEPETGQILHTEADTGAGPGPDPVLPPATPEPPAVISQYREGPLVVVLDHSDGTIAVHHDRHLGPVLSLRWPVPGPPYLTGWRRPLRRRLDIEPLERTGERGGHGWRVSEQYGQARLLRDTEMSGGVLRTRLWWQGAAPAGRLRTMLVGGLRCALLFTGEQYVPAGRGLFPIDATEFGAAGMRLDADTGLAWWDPRTGVAVRVLRPGRQRAGARLIAENVVALDTDTDADTDSDTDTDTDTGADADADAGSEYVIEVGTAQRPGEVVPGARPAIAAGYRTCAPAVSQQADAGREADVECGVDGGAAAGWSAAQVARRPVFRLTHRDTVLMLDPQAAGVVSWRCAGGPVLATPFPRSRVFARNTAWSAGMWAGRQAPRSEPRRGMGWGDPDSARAWHFDPVAGRLAAADVGWSASPGADGIRLTADAQALPEDGELVLWITPAAKSAAALVPGAPGETWLLDKAGAWQRWCDRLAVRLDDGRWLHIAAAPCSPAGQVGGADEPGAAEILLRATPSGVLLALVTRQSAGQPGAAAWQLTVVNDAEAAQRLLVPDPRTEPALTGAAEQ